MKSFVNADLAVALTSVLACDLPFVSASLLEQMIDLATDCDVVIPDTGDGLHPLHAVYRPFAGLTDERPGGAMDRDMRAEAETRRNDWCATQGLAAELCAVTPITGSLGEVIGREVRAFRPDLIALGAHTRGGLAPHTLGSFAAELIRNPPTDLLLARG